jgi:hypothetical protein
MKSKLGRKNPQTATALATLAYTLLRMGNYSKAMHTFRKVRKSSLLVSQGVETAFSANILYVMADSVPSGVHNDPKIIFEHIEYAHAAITAYRSLNQVFLSPICSLRCVLLLCQCILALCAFTLPVYPCVVCFY